MVDEPAGPTGVGVAIDNSALPQAVDPADPDLWPCQSAALRSGQPDGLWLAFSAARYE